MILRVDTRSVYLTVEYVILGDEIGGETVLSLMQRKAQGSD